MVCFDGVGNPRWGHPPVAVKDAQEEPYGDATSAKPSIMSTT